MAQVYALNLVEEKKYVGYTERGVIRILEHLKAYNPHSLDKTPCSYFIPAKISKSGKELYGRRCRQRRHNNSEFCKSHNSLKYRKKHEKWLEENESAQFEGYGETPSSFSGFNSAKWVEKFRPTSWDNALIEVINDCTIEDEDRITLEYMRDFGIENVRGGRWAHINLRPEQITAIKRLIEDLD